MTGRHVLTWLAGLSLATGALVLGACGGNDAVASTEVRPFSDIQDSDFAFENDPATPDRGIFRVTTTEATICAIVWGETEALGRFNNSTDMNGTGIIEHNVFLPGAVPGQTYFYRVQGSTADGTLYQSDIASFTLPARAGGVAIPTADAGLDARLITNATIAEVSSEFSDAWAGANAIDGQTSTEWSSAGDGDGAFITIDLGEVRRVAGIEFVTRSMADGSATALTYSVSVDGGEPVGPFGAATLASGNVETVDLEGRTFRFEVTESTGGNTGAVEIRLYAPEQ